MFTVELAAQEFGVQKAAVAGQAVTVLVFEGVPEIRLFGGIILQKSQPEVE